MKLLELKDKLKADSTIILIEKKKCRVLEVDEKSVVFEKSSGAKIRARWDENYEIDSFEEPTFCKECGNRIYN